MVNKKFISGKLVETMVGVTYNLPNEPDYLNNLSALKQHYEYTYWKKDGGLSGPQQNALYSLLNLKDYERLYKEDPFEYGQFTIYFGSKSLKNMSLLCEKVMAGLSGRVLDVGCGNGGLIDRIEKEFKPKECIGIDISPDAVSLGRELGRTNLKVADARQPLPFEKEYFDVVFSTTVLGSPKLNKGSKYVLENLLDVLKVGGMFITNDGIKNTEKHIYKTVDKLLIHYTIITIENLRRVAEGFLCSYMEKV